MPHQLSKVIIKNYKSCRETELKLLSYTPLVGYNNAGKSNALSAIQWLLRKSSLKTEDYFDPEMPIEVIGIIDGISTELLNEMPAKQKASIKKYIK